MRVRLLLERGALDRHRLPVLGVICSLLMDVELQPGAPLLVGGEPWEGGTEKRPRTGVGGRGWQPAWEFRSCWDAMLVPVAAVAKEKKFCAFRQTDFYSGTISLKSGSQCVHSCHLQPQGRPCRF